MTGRSLVTFVIGVVLMVTTAAPTAAQSPQAPSDIWRTFAEKLEPGALVNALWH